jgi:hypothetical protein
MSFAVCPGKPENVGTIDWPKPCKVDQWKSDYEENDIDRMSRGNDFGSH